MTTYERVTIQPEGGGRRKAMFLQDPAETPLFLIGTQVDNEGDEIVPSGAYLRKHGAETGTVIQMIALELVVAREPMVIDYTYGWLVPDGTATQQVGAV